MMNNPEYEILLRSMQLVDINTASVEASNTIMSREIDWERLYLLSRTHAIRPQLASLMTLISECNLPRDFSDKLQEDIHENLIIQLRNIAEFFRIKSKLESSGIMIVPYKGFSFGHNLYGSTANRESGDIDLFVDVRDIPEIKKLMSELGYEVWGKLKRLSDNYILDKCAEYNFALYEEGRCLYHVEFHWRPAVKALRMEMKMSELLPEIYETELQGNKLHVFSPETEFLIALIHHGGKDDFSKLKYILDIALFIKKYPDLNWNKIINQARSLHMEKLVYIGVLLASGITGIQIPSPILAKTKSKNIVRLVSGRYKYLANQVPKKSERSDWLFRIRSRDGFLTRLQLLSYGFLRMVIMHLLPYNWHYFFLNNRLTNKFASSLGI